MLTAIYLWFHFIPRRAITSKSLTDHPGKIMGIAQIHSQPLADSSSEEVHHLTNTPCAVSFSPFSPPTTRTRTIVLGTRKFCRIAVHREEELAGGNEITSVSRITASDVFLMIH